MLHTMLLLTLGYYGYCTAHIRSFSLQLVHSSKFGLSITQTRELLLARCMLLAEAPPPTPNYSNRWCLTRHTDTRNGRRRARTLALQLSTRKRARTHRAGSRICEAGVLHVVVEASGKRGRTARWLRIEPRARLCSKRRDRRLRTPARTTCHSPEACGPMRVAARILDHAHTPARSTRRCVLRHPVRCA